jgi:hypothetical protein
MLSELETVAARIGIVLGVERLEDELGARGGLCRVRGRSLILIDASLSLTGRIAILARALSAFDVSLIHVPPVVRARIDSSTALRSARPRRPALSRRSRQSYSD